MQLFVCTLTPFIATTNNSSLKTVKSSVNYLPPPLIIHVCLFSDLISNYETLFIIENIKRNFKMVELTHKVFYFKLNRLTAVVLLSTNSIVCVSTPPMPKVPIFLSIGKQPEDYSIFPNQTQQRSQRHF